jgi:hypothetical protein
LIFFGAAKENQSVFTFPQADTLSQGQKIRNVTMKS